MSNEKFRAAALAVSLLAAMTGGALAQTEPPEGQPAGAANETQTDDDGFDLGWLGLIGLLGLAGLARRKDTVHRHTTTGTTGTTGTTRI